MQIKALPAVAIELHPMEMPSVPNLEGLTEIGLRGGVDMRPTLLRVLTDLYVQKLTHTEDEERHYTELAGRLLESVDVATRSAVAARLARHLSPPPLIIQRLAADLPEVSTPLRSLALAPAPLPVERDFSVMPNVESVRSADAELSRAGGALPAMPDQIDSEVAAELTELFFAARADERRLILLSLDIVAPSARAGIVQDSTIGPKLEAAILARKRDDFVQILVRSLRISQQQAQRIARDESGEPIVVAAKALNISREVLYRILLFINPAVGHSVERVHSLANLYDEITMRAAQDLITIWQALNAGTEEGQAPAHQPLLAGDAPGVRARASATTQRTPAPAQNIGRREAS